MLPEDLNSHHAPPDHCSGRSVSLQMCVVSWELTGSKLGRQCQFMGTKTSSRLVPARCWVGSQKWASSAKSECFRDKATVWCLFSFWQKLMLPSYKQIKWCRLFSPPDICDSFSFEDLNILVPVFPECVKEDHFLLLYSKTEENKEKRRWIVTVGAGFIICAFVSGEVWWMSVVTGTPGLTEHKGLFSRWVPGPKDAHTHLAEILSDSENG